MIEDWKWEEMLGHQDSSLTLRNMEKIRDLRILLGATQNRLSKLEKDQGINKELILQERTILEATQREIRRLGKNSLLSEFQIDLRRDDLI